MKNIISKKATPYLLILPAFLFLTIILIYPLIYNVYLSFLNWRLTSPGNIKFVGFENYINLFLKHPDFYDVSIFSIGFTIATIFLEFIIGLLSALLLYGLIKNRKLVTSILLTPYMVAPIAVGLSWRLIWDRDLGLANYLLVLLGFNKINWLAESIPAFWSIVISEVWRSTPFVTMILLAGLSSLPRDVFEAAHVDGANRWQVFKSITFPLLLPPLAVALMFQTIFKLRVFDIPYILTEGGPGTSTMPYGMLIHKTYFKYFDVGKAAAISVVLMVIGILVAMFYVKLSKIKK